MKTVIFLIAVLVGSITIDAQTQDTSFNRRLNAFLTASRTLDFETVLGLTHPRLFDLAPREQLIEVLKETYSNDVMEMSLDSIYVIEISADFRDDTALYKQVRYSSILKIQLKDSSTWKDDGMMNLIKSSLQAKGEVEYDEVKHILTLKGTSLLFAIKDNNPTPWLFLGYEKENIEMLKMLLNEKVLTHFKLLE
jgi:hypothetical protein